jgi:hypothetical protein
VPYNGANSDTDLGSKNIKTTRVPTGTDDLTNKNYVDAGLGTKVPYTGAVYDLDLGAQDLSAAVITGTQFILSGTAPTPARVAGYDTTGLYYLTTPATYLTNLSSDPQTQINAKFNSSGGTISGNVSLTGTNKITQAYNALTSDTTTLVNRQTLDSAISSASLLPLNNSWSGTNSFSNTVTLSPAIATPSYTLGVNASNQIVKYTPSSGIGGSVTSGYIPYASATNTLADSLLYKSGNNTGIGTTSPAGRFTIYATSSVDADRLTSLVIDTYRAGIRLTSNATAGCDWNMYVEAAGGSPPQDALCFYNQGTSQFRMVITRDGNVAVGTTNPTGKLTVYSSTADYTNSLVVNTAWPSITLDGTGTTGRKWSILNGASGSGVGQGNFGIFDITGNAYRLSIDSSGNVGIGVDTATYKLQVAGTGLFGYIAGSKKGIFIANEDSYGTTPCIQGVSSGLGTNSISLNPGGGNVAIGKTNPAQLLDVSGDGARIQVESNTANNAVFQIKTNSYYNYLYTDQVGRFILANASNNPIIAGTSGDVTIGWYSSAQYIGSPSYIVYYNSYYTNIFGSIVGAITPSSIPVGYNYIPYGYLAGNVSSIINNYPQNYIPGSYCSRWYVPYTGLWAITWAFQFNSGNNIEIFISKDGANNNDLNTNGIILALRALDTNYIREGTLSWTGYIATSSYFSLGFYTGSTADMTYSPRNRITITLVQKTG